MRNRFPRFKTFDSITRFHNHKFNGSLLNFINFQFSYSFHQNFSFIPFTSISWIVPPYITACSIILVLRDTITDPQYCSVPLSSDHLHLKFKSVIYGIEIYYCT